MKTKITQGNWQVKGFNDVGTDTKPVCHVYSGNNIPEAEANAKLIAAAPELLEAIKLLLWNAEIDALNESEDENPDLHDAINKAKEAIQKATE